MSVRSPLPAILTLGGGVLATLGALPAMPAAAEGARWCTGVMHMPRSFAGLFDAPMRPDLRVVVSLPPQACGPDRRALVAALKRAGIRAIGPRPALGAVRWTSAWPSSPRAEWLGRWEALVWTPGELGEGRSPRGHGDDHGDSQGDTGTTGKPGARASHKPAGSPRKAPEGGRRSEGGDASKAGGTSEAGGMPGDRRSSESRRPSKGDIAASFALRRLGTPFSWGGGSSAGPTRGIGRGAATVGFDCSGLTLYAWSKAGVKLGHYTGTQFRQGRRVPLGDLRRGDLVFFGGGTGDPTHVGLYLGGGVMIHAPKTGDVVRKTRFLTSSYYRTIYRGAVRPG
ncbi:C40 family peptidase [Thermoactinospora rubra]|uniref:C40 family peptidase n=1 Tax=Thermoactinospora rubra TaxID=1088767 RepID=UPI000A10F53F|nr:NlpC/P60 family protein [Thermoactinospora rubra]